MPQSLGSTTKSIFLNSESGKLALEFEAIGDIGVITLSADLAASDVVAGTINGQAFTATYASSHAATMTALKNAIVALSGVDTAVVHGATSRIISFLLTDTLADIVMADVAVTNGGSGTATATASVVEARIHAGDPVILIGVGEKIAPVNEFARFGMAAANTNLLGVSIHSPAKGELATVMVKGYAVIFGQASSAVVPGIVAHAGYDTSTGYTKFATGATGTTIGLALDAGSDGDVIRVLMLN